MPRSRSKSPESITRSATASLARNTPLLPQQLVHQGGLAVVYVGNDGHVAQVFSLCHIDCHSFLHTSQKSAFS